MTEKAVFFLIRWLFGLFEDTTQHSPYVDNSILEFYYYTALFGFSF
jgi:hypothetical protein